MTKTSLPSHFPRGVGIRIFPSPMSIHVMDWGRTGTVVRIADYGPRCPWFETWPGRRSL